MDTLAVTHLVVLGLWGGVVLTEVLLEVGGMTGRFQERFVAEFHAATDRFVELPLLFLVILTGGLLWQRTGWSPELIPKIGFSLGAVVANATNAWFVQRRFGGKKEAVPYLAILAATVLPGLALATVAFYLGGLRAGFW